MALEIIWTREAKEQLAEIITFLESDGGERMLQHFSHQLDKKLELVKDQPKMYQKSDRLEGVRRCIVDKNYSFLYSHDNLFVYILTIYSNRQKPM